MFFNRRVGGDYQILQVGPGSGDDQVLKIDGPVEGIVLIDHIDGVDIVILAGLVYQGPHGLPDSKSLLDNDEIGSHLAADLIVII